MGISIFQAFEPDIYRLVISSQYQKLFMYIISVVLLIIILTFVFILLSKEILNYLTSSRYTEAYKYANIMSVGTVFYILFSFLSAIILALEKSRIALYITVSVGILSIFIYREFIAIWGFIGAAFSKVILFAILSCISLAYIIIFIKKNARGLLNKDYHS
jgi:Na+-driven multidrug efflux pump